MSRWTPPVAMSSRESTVLTRSKRKLYVFFRQYRHLLLDEEVQAKLEAMYAASGRGRPPVPPALLALAMLMQVAFDVPDHEVPELTACDLRWQMVLDCVGVEEPLFSQGLVFNFRTRAMAHGVDRLLIEKVVALARANKGFGAANLRAAFDSSPLLGAGRVEDTYNLIAHAARKVVKVVAEALGEPYDDVAARAGIPIVAASSTKAALDLDWSAPEARRNGLLTLLKEVDALRVWLETHMAEQLGEEPLRAAWGVVSQLIEQDTEPDPSGTGRRIKEEVAKDRRISVEDADMRHGRKSSSKLFNGYKRHVAVDLDLDMVIATEVAPANRPESEAAKPLLEQVEAQGRRVEELHVDRGYVDSEAVHERREAGMQVIAKPYPVTNPDHFTKEAFALDFASKTITCPARVVVRFEVGSVVEFPASSCDPCPLRPQCTSRKTGRGRSVQIKPREEFQVALRENLSSVEGRAKLRKRVVVEHGLARLSHLGGTRARFKGLAKNQFDLRRQAAVQNCYVLAEILSEAA